ncbi:MAG: low affinity iron permease family protein [Thermomicrobiales bacterium]
MARWFARIASRTSAGAGHYLAFVIALGIVLVWAATGPIFGFSNTWQLVINTGTTVVTFLMVFLIQNSQNRDSKAIHLKLDELIRCTERANNALIDAEQDDDERLDELRKIYSAISKKHVSAREEAIEVEMKMLEKVFREKAAG